MSVTEMCEFIGAKGSVDLNGLKVSVIVTDVKQSYGVIRLKVKPTAGSGEIWCNEASVTRLR